MKVIIAGGRDMNDYKLVKTFCDAVLKNVPKNEIEIVSGACSTGVVTYVRPDGTNVCGADGCGEKYAAFHGYPCTIFPAHWDTHGKAAGGIRNQQMADYLEADKDGCILFWDGNSRGTEDMGRRAGKKGLKIRMKRYSK